MKAKAKRQLIAKLQNIAAVTVFVIVSVPVIAIAVNGLLLMAGW